MKQQFDGKTESGPERVEFGGRSEMESDGETEPDGETEGLSQTGRTSRMGGLKGGGLN